MTEMELSGKLAADELDELARLLRSRWYWLRFLVANLYGILLIGTLAMVTMAALWEGAAVNWMMLGAAWGVVVAIFGWTWFSTRGHRSRELARINANLPDTIRLDAAGLVFEGPDGESGRVPWDHCVGWRERRRVLIVDRHSGRSSVAFSISTLSDMDRERLRGLLTAHVPRRE